MNVAANHLITCSLKCKFTGSIKELTYIKNENFAKIESF